jgi:hypothetical protein
MNIPSVITAGDSVAWTDVSTVDTAGQPVDSRTYALTYSFRGPAVGGNADVSGNAQGTGWATALTTAQTAAFNVGSTQAVWYWQAFATKAGTRVTVGKGQLVVRPNLGALSTGAVFDGRTQSEIDLAAVRAEMSARLNNGVTVEYTIGSRSLKKEPMAALIQMEQRLCRLVARERRAAAAANGLGLSGRLGVRF